MDIGFKTFHPIGGVVEEEIILQQLKFMLQMMKAKKLLMLLVMLMLMKQVKNITPADIISSISYFFNLLHGVGDTDDIDHLGNRRLTFCW